MHILCSFCPIQDGTFLLFLYSHIIKKRNILNKMEGVVQFDRDETYFQDTYNRQLNSIMFKQKKCVNDQLIITWLQ